MCYNYKNAACILPIELLEAIQEYLDGDTLYIPRKQENRLKWGERQGSRGSLLHRNEEIFEKYGRGISVQRLAEEYYLSDKTIYKILKNQTKKA
ncbi:MAG: CD3324 family protein [Christensenellaceae bacterium]|jgi:Mor family transcriptional regulator